MRILFLIAVAALALSSCNGEAADTTASSSLPATSTSTTIEQPTTTSSSAWDQTERCDNPGGFAISYPAAWQVNSGEILAPCSVFSPEPIEVEPATDVRPGAIVATIDEVDFATAAAPAARELSRAVTAIEGHQAVRVERTATGEALYPAGTRQASYIIDLTLGEDEPTQTLIVDTVELPGFDYEQNVEVLDQMAATIDIPSTDGISNVVARYEGGGGGFSVEARPEDGEVCLVIPPEGEPSCLRAPAADQIEITRLPLIGDRLVISGLAGSNVFRIEAHEAEGAVFVFLPVRIPGNEVAGWAFGSTVDDIRRFVWYDIGGNDLGSAQADG